MVDSANLTERINTITSLQGYVYRLWRYDVSHSVLTIRAVDPDDKKPCVLITFNFVTYLQILLFWTGDFEVAPKSERLEMARARGFAAQVDDDKLDDLLSQGSHTMLRANAPEGAICIFGILQDVETCD